MDDQGTIFGIFIASEKGAPVHKVDRIEAVAGIGLKGDRNYFKQLHLSEDNRKPENELTLVEWESAEMLNNSPKYGPIEPGDLRRNLVTKNIRLNELVGKIFKIGDVTAEGLELCEPCQYLEKLIAKPIIKPLVHKAGIRARIVTGGIIKKNDSVSIPISYVIQPDQ